MKFRRKFNIIFPKIFYYFSLNQKDCAKKFVTRKISCKGIFSFSAKTSVRNV